MTSASLPSKTNPPPNFFVQNSVVLPVSLKEAYTTLGTSAGHERVCRLSKLCTAFELKEKDVVELPIPSYPDGLLLKDVSVRTFTLEGETTAVLDSSTREGENKPTLTRQHFTMVETVPLFFGMFRSKVILTGTLSWDNDALATLSSDSGNEENHEIYALYESISDGGLVVWKLRTFTVEDGDPLKTRVTERIEGWAPTLLRAIVQKEAEKAHRCVCKLCLFKFIRNGTRFFHPQGSPGSIPPTFLITLVVVIAMLLYICPLWQEVQDEEIHISSKLMSQTTLVR